MDSAADTRYGASSESAVAVRGRGAERRTPVTTPALVASGGGAKGPKVRREEQIAKSFVSETPVKR